MASSVRSGLAVLAALTSGAALAQTQPAPPAAPQPQQDIVVSGSRPLPPREARSYVADITRPVDGQLARFHEPICPGVVGLAAEYGDRIAARIRALAEQAGVPVAKPGCADNVLVVITPDGRSFIKGVQKAEPRIFEAVDPYALKRLIASDGPVRVWRASEVRNEDGQGVGHPGPAAPGAKDYANTLRVNSVSIVNPSTERASLQSVVVFDEQATIGKTLGQLADYAAMRALGGAEPPRRDGTSRDTILALFDPDATAPRAATALDIAYLEGLYRVRANATGLNQQSAIARSIAKGKASAGQR